MTRLFLFVFVAFCAASAQAQTFLDDLKQPKSGQGTVTVVQSSEIDSLVNGHKRVTTTQPQHGSTTLTSSPQQHGNTSSDMLRDIYGNHNEADNERKTTTATEKTPSTQETDIDDMMVDTRKKVMRNSYKTTGYRIQVYSGGNSRADRHKAENTGTVMKQHFPNEPIYVHFYSPSWKCRMGNYTSLEEARRVLAQVKSLGFTQANIVKGTIQVQY